MTLIPLPRLKPLRERSRLSILTLFSTVVIAWIALAGQARADVIVDFENNPNLPAQPNNFNAAGATQTYSQAGAYSISGGVALGNPTFLAAFAAHGSAPNLYGTADFADPSLLPTITLTLPGAELVTNVSGVFFNGQSVAETYVLTAQSGATTVGTQTFTLPAATSTADFSNFSLTSTTALPITSVTFTTPNAGANGYDFFVDTIHITPGSAVAVPEPSPFALAGALGALGMAGAWLRRKRAAA